MSKGNVDEIELVLLIGATSPKTILGLLKQNGYEVQESEKKQTQLKKYLYFDTPDRQFYKSDRIFRIRLQKEGKKKHKVTYKSPNSESSDKEYANKKEINVKFEGKPTLETALFHFRLNYPDILLPDILQNIANLQKVRTVYDLVDENGAVSEIAFDDIIAINPHTNESRKLSREAEIELISAPVETLDRIKGIISAFDPSIMPSRKSKYQLALDAIDNMNKLFTR